MAVIHINDVSKWYGEVIGISGVSSCIEPGVTGLLGPNGAGKTTLFKMMTGQIRPQTGDIRVDDMRVWNNPPVFERIGYVPASERNYDLLTGEELLIYLARLSGMSAAEARKRAGECMEEVSMTDAAHRRFGSYSKGMRQRVKFAQAILHDPDVLLLDEPLAGMDPVSRHHIVQLVQRWGERGKTIVVSSHILHEVEEMTNRIMLLNHGLLLAEGVVHEIRELIEEQPRHVKLITPDRQRLSNLMIQYPEVQTIRFGESEDELIIQTLSPDDFFPRLNTLVMEDGIDIQEVVTLDDNLQSVFEYLVQ